MFPKLAPAGFGAGVVCALPYWRVEAGIGLMLGARKPGGRDPSTNGVRGILGPGTDLGPFVLTFGEKAI
jgi:hypothetical protein